MALNSKDSFPQSNLIVHRSLADAISHFSPTPRPVVCFIAPHVFDEQWRRRRRNPRPKNAFFYAANGTAKSSPLRFSVEIIWDEYSISVDKEVAENVCTEGAILEENRGKADEEEFRVLEQVPNPAPITTKPKLSLLKSKSPWDKLRVNGHMFKTIAIAIKLNAEKSKKAITTRMLSNVTPSSVKDPQAAAL